MRGCPARAPLIKTLLKTIKAKSAADGSSRKHAFPMTIEDISQLIRWSESICSPASISEKATGAQEQTLTAMVRHAFMHAFVTTAFTLWTRCVDSHLGHLESNIQEWPCRQKLRAMCIARSSHHQRLHATTLQLAPPPCRHRQQEGLAEKGQQ